MKKEFVFVTFLFIIIVLVFLYPLLKGHIPFPGDLVVGGVEPYRSQSYSGIAPGGVPNKAQGIDVIKELYPWKHFVIEMMTKGQIAFWNPYNFSGNPMMANFQSGNFYPVNFIFLILPFNNAWSLFIFLIPLLCALFTYLYLRLIKINIYPSIFGSIIFAFSSYIIVWLEYGNIGHTLLWLPLGLYFTEKLITDFKRKYLISITLILFTACLAGYIQGYFYVTFCLIYYFIFKSFLNKQFKFKKIFIFIVAIISPLLLASFQILPTLELFQNSSRGNYTLLQMEKLLNPWWYAVTAMVPDFFGNPAARNHTFYGTYIERVSYFGVIPLITALIALTQFKKRKEIIIFGSLFIFSFILAYDLFFIKFLYMIPVPIISTTVPTRILSLFIFSGSILAAIGLDLIIKYNIKKYVFSIIGILIFTISLIWVYTILSNALVSQRNLIIPTLILLIFIVLYWFYYHNKKFTVIFIILILFITGIDLFRFTHKITPFSPEEYIYPPTQIISFIQKNTGFYRYWGYNKAHLEPNIQLFDHTYLPDGHDALHLKSYARFLSTSNDGQLNNYISRSDSEIKQGNEVNELKNNNNRKKILNLLGVKYIILKDEFMEQDSTFRLVWDEFPWKIYENRQVGARAFLTKNYRVITDKEKIINTFYQKDFDEKKTIILEQNPELNSTPLKLNTVKFKKYEPNKVVIETISDAQALLFLSDTYYPGWKAKIDGIESNIFIADFTFRAVVVPAGRHNVEFYYFPDSFRNGLIISLFSIVALISIIYLPNYFRKK